MNETLEQRLALRGRARLEAPRELLELAFPEPPAERHERGPVLAIGVAAAGALALPAVRVQADSAFERRAAAITLELATALTELPR
ncbi:hypothetical protein [Engelhardtia mirabilis]|uniref:Uncharacterized protein n=1 Tax=Engelhardtia mirabilis TaxID=2528011 RepID=A0A518BNR6_9BACT|nr:hypothetical protein Pla133_37070 [Planctomycetes bacterium Pla133]QDV02932.1 hypothetical protein Pla86_37050 [Planctomycetes bacterium Pla86]